METWMVMLVAYSGYRAVGVAQAVAGACASTLEAACAVRRWCAAAPRDAASWVSLEQTDDDEAGDAEAVTVHSYGVGPASEANGRDRIRIVRAHALMPARPALAPPL